MTEPPRVTAFTRFGDPLGDLTGIVEMKWSEEINGEDKLTVTMFGTPPAKETRLVWRDRWGTWHEHVVTNIETSHADSRPTSTVYAVSSISELAQDYVVEKRPGLRTPVPAASALADALETTRWGVGSVDVSKRAGASLYHCSAYEALSTIVGTWGGEVVAEITVDPASGVTARKVGLRTHRGDSTPARRLDFGRDLASVKRTIEDDAVITACYAWGKGEEVGDGYGRRIGIADVTQDGLPYVHDDSLLATWGLPRGDGTVMHRFGNYVNESCSDPEVLMAEAEAYLAEHSMPRVSYEGDVIAYAVANADVDGIRLGDEVYVVDGGFDPPIRTQARAVKIETDLLDPSSTVVTLGNFLGTLADQFGKLQGMIGTLSAKSAMYDVASDAAPSYVDAVISQLNAMFEESGGYVTIDMEKGITVTNAATFDESTSAMQINGQGFRIANSKNGTEWNWRTFGTGAGFTADEIVSGTIRADLIDATDLAAERLVSAAGSTTYGRVGENVVGIEDGYALYQGDALSYALTAGDVSSSVTASGKVVSLSVPLPSSASTFKAVMQMTPSVVSLQSSNDTTANKSAYLWISTDGFRIGSLRAGGGYDCVLYANSTGLYLTNGTRTLTIATF